VEDEIQLSIDYEDLRDWLACPNCESRDAKVEKGSLQLYCPNCSEREQLVTGDTE
jgi:Zn finger protein HypA/HybF involved in hydrogenase expression